MFIINKKSQLLVTYKVKISGVGEETASAWRVQWLMVNHESATFGHHAGCGHEKLCDFGGTKIGPTRHTRNDWRALRDTHI